MREKLVIFGKYFLTLLNIIAAVASIFGLIYAIQSQIPIWTYIFSISAAICILSIIAVIGVHLSIKNDRISLGKVYSKCFHELLHDIRNYLEEDDYICKNQIYSNAFEYKKKVTEISIALMNKLSARLTEAFGIDIRACVKLFGFIDANYEKSMLMTLARNETDLNNMLREQYKKIKVCENTDFEKIFQSTKDSDENAAFFFQEDLIKYSKKNEYKNSTKDWQKRYKTTIVMPIRYLRIDIKDIEEPSYDLLGFLCVDSKNTKAFSSGYTTFIIELLKGIADILYHYYDGCTTYYEYLQTKGD